MLPPSPQGVGGLASAAQAKAEAAARARAAEQMALEDAWKALNPDFRTPFASVEDAVSRCVRARARSIDRRSIDRSSSPPAATTRGVGAPLPRGLARLVLAYSTRVLYRDLAFSPFVRSLPRFFLLGSFVHYLCWVLGIGSSLHVVVVGTV
jgi:hypothetical protein